MGEEAHCRVGRVRMKEGGADVRVLPGSDLNQYGRDLLGHARGIATAEGQSMVGFFMLVWDQEGGYRHVFQFEESGPIPKSLFPAWVEEIVRREIVTTAQIKKVIEII